MNEPLSFARRLFRIVAAMLFLTSICQNIVTAGEPLRTVNHYLEGNVSASYISTTGNRANDINTFSPGFHIAHGSQITPVHALVMSFGQDFISTSKNASGTLTEVTFFLRRYMPKYSTPKWQLYSNIGSGYYSYAQKGVAGVLESGGVLLGVGMDYLLSRKIRLSWEANYRGFSVKQFGNKDIDRIRPFSLFLGVKYFYLTTNY